MTLIILQTQITAQDYLQSHYIQIAFGQSCLGVARVMSEQKVPRSVEQRIVINFLVGENVPSAEIHHRLQQQYVVGVCGEFQRTGRFLQRGI